MNRLTQALGAPARSSAGRPGWSWRSGIRAAAVAAALTTGFLAQRVDGAAAAEPAGHEDAAAQVALHRPGVDDYWRQVVTRAGVRYRSPRGVYWYEAPILTTCGAFAPAAAYYCPHNRSVYIGSGLVSRLTAGGLPSFAAVAVLAHEWGHHVQQLLGWSRYAENRRLFAEEELQADCYAGMYVRSARARGKLGAEDVETALALLGDAGDPHGASQERAGAHGSGEARARWFRVGLEHGALGACNAVVYGKRAPRLTPLRRGR